MRQIFGLWLGLVLFGLVLWLPAPAGMSPDAQKVAAVATLMAVWWISEALPIAATALLPVVLFPLLDVADPGRVTAAYGHHLIFLFLGGFLIAVTIQRWDLHRRIALHTIRVVGTSPQRMILGFMVATALLSMWISNTAAVMMMVPIAAAVAMQTGAGNHSGGVDHENGFAPVLMLGIAYSASIGGTATLIGTPPNAILAGMADQLYGIRIGFAQWMAFGLPLAVVFLLFTWWYLIRFFYHGGPVMLSGGDDLVDQELGRLGPVSRDEKMVLAVFLAVALCWILRGLFGGGVGERIEDSTIAIVGALLLFLLPASDGGRLLDWETALRIPWGILLLFGGGFALATGFQQSGLSVWIGESMLVLEHAGPVILVILVGTLVKFLTEITSNTATATLLIPVMGAFAEAAGMSPIILMVSVAVSASLAFMLPVATPPNAIIFGTPYITVPQMARAGLWLNLIAIPLLAVFVIAWLPLLWNVPLTP